MNYIEQIDEKRNFTDDFNTRLYDLVTDNQVIHQVLSDMLIRQRSLDIPHDLLPDFLLASDAIQIIKMSDLYPAKDIAQDLLEVDYLSDFEKIVKSQSLVTLYTDLAQLICDNTTANQYGVILKIRKIQNDCLIYVLPDIKQIKSYVKAFEKHDYAYVSFNRNQYENLAFNVYQEYTKYVSLKQMYQSIIDAVANKHLAEFDQKILHAIVDEIKMCQRDSIYNASLSSDVLKQLIVDDQQIAIKKFLNQAPLPLIQNDEVPEPPAITMLMPKLQFMCRELLLELLGVDDEHVLHENYISDDGITMIVVADLLAKWVSLHRKELAQLEDEYNVDITLLPKSSLKEIAAALDANIPLHLSSSIGFSPRH